MATGRLLRLILTFGASLGPVMSSTSRVMASSVFFGPSPYLSFADSPFNHTNRFSYFYLEDFEDGQLNTPGVTASSGWQVLAQGPLTDSVDGDDGDIDGSGTGGHSFFSNLSSTTLTVTFHPENLGGHLPTHAGIVCT